MNEIICGDALTVLRTLQSDSIDMCVTSPPYFGLRDYGCVGQIGLEDTPEQYIYNLTLVFMEVYRVLKPPGTLWINIADSYVCASKSAWNGLKPKDMIGIPWMLAFSLRDNGWYLRSDIIWQKPNCMPESTKDRPTSSYEHIFLLSKSRRYYFDNEAIKEPVAVGTIERLKRGISNNHKYSSGFTGQKKQSINNPRKNRMSDNIDLPIMRNKRDIWTVSTKAYKDAHFATYPI